MLVELQKAEITGNLLAENSMQIDIGDPEIVMNILADKLYNDKARIVLQEYACNARDAHREAGCAELPIEIDLPGKMVPALKIRDFGPGMDPDRVYNVFRRLGNSTKRGDNLQTGGFGIGAKCGYAYHTRTFTVVTVYNGTQYTYHCYRAGTGKFMMDLLGHEETERPSGTEIQIPVDAEDHQKFRSYATWIFEDWEVPPKLNLPVLSTPPIAHAAPDGSWAFRKSAVPFTSVVASVDGIPYDTGKSYASRLFEDNQLVLRFSPGELTLAANRESLEKTNANENKIQQRLEAAMTELRAEMSARYFDPSIPLFSQLSSSSLKVLLDLKLIELPPDLAWPPPFEIIGVDTWSCTVRTPRGGHHGKRLENWSTRQIRYYASDEYTLIFSKDTPIDRMREYVRRVGVAGKVYTALRLQDGSNLALLNRYYPTNHIIDIPTVRAERTPQPKGRVTVGILENGRWVNRRMFPHELAARHWIPKEEPPHYGIKLLLPDGGVAQLPRGSYLRLNELLNDLPKLGHLVMVPDKLKKLTAGQAQILPHQIEILQRHDLMCRWAAVIDRLCSVARKQNCDQPGLLAILGRTDPALRDMVAASSRRLIDVSVFRHLFEPIRLPDFSALGRAVYRISKLCKKDPALRSALIHLPHHIDTATDPCWIAYVDLLYNAYFRKVLEA